MDPWYGCNWLCVSLKNFFTHICEINPICIRLPNGASIHPKFKGIIHFNQDFFLHYVFYIPDFCTNLISIPKLVVSLDCHFVFDSTHCTIHGNHHLKKIGATRLIQGLYLLTYPYLSTHSHETFYNQIRKDNCNMWHRRLVHPFRETMIHINKIFPIDDLNKTVLPCDTCLFSKHKMLPIHNSTTTYANIFTIWCIWTFGVLLRPHLCLVIDTF